MLLGVSSVTKYITCAVWQKKKVELAVGNSTSKIYSVYDVKPKDRSEVGLLS